MGTLKDLKKAGLKDDLENILTKFVKEGDAETRKLLTDSIDNAGMRDPKTMQVIGGLQKSGKIGPGLYKELIALNERLSKGSGATTPPPVTQSATVAEGEKEAVMSEDKVAAPAAQPAAQAAPVAEAAPANVVSIEGFNLSDKQKEKLKSALKKKEDSVRARLAQYEQKAIERLKARAEKKAQRQGLKVEELQEIKVRKEQVTFLRDEVKERRAKIKTLREELKALKPKRAKDPEKAAAKAAAKEAAKAAAASA